MSIKLWKKLGEVLEENINSDNFRQKVERKYNVSQGDNSGYSLQVNELNGDINICDRCSHNPNNKKDQVNSTTNNKHLFPIINNHQLKLESL